MEGKRLLLAIVLSFLLLFVWQLIMVKKKPELQAPAEQTAKLETGPAQPAPEQKKVEGRAPVEVPKTEANQLNIKQIAAQGEEQVTVSTSL